MLDNDINTRSRRAHANIHEFQVSNYFSSQKMNQNKFHQQFSPKSEGIFLQGFFWGLIWFLLLTQNRTWLDDSAGKFKFEKLILCSNCNKFCYTRFYVWIIIVHFLLICLFCLYFFECTLFLCYKNVNKKVCWFSKNV